MGSVCGPNCGWQPAYDTCLQSVADQSRNRAAHRNEGQSRQQDGSGQATTCVLPSSSLPPPWRRIGRDRHRTRCYAIWLPEVSSRVRAATSNSVREAYASIRPVTIRACMRVVAARLLEAGQGFAPLLHMGAPYGRTTFPASPRCHVPPLFRVVCGPDRRRSQPDLPVRKPALRWPWV